MGNLPPILSSAQSLCQLFLFFLKHIVVDGDKQSHLDLYSAFCRQLQVLVLQVFVPRCYAPAARAAWKRNRKRPYCNKVCPSLSNQFKFCFALRVPPRLCPAIKGLIQLNHVPDCLRHCISDALPSISGGDIGAGQPVLPKHTQPVAVTPDQCGKRKRNPSHPLWDEEFSDAPAGDVLSTLLPPSLLHFDSARTSFCRPTVGGWCTHTANPALYTNMYQRVSLRKNSPLFVAWTCVDDPPYLPSYAFLRSSKINITHLHRSFPPN